jgi:hypothetical protein
MFDSAAVGSVNDRRTESDAGQRPTPTHDALPVRADQLDGLPPHGRLRVVRWRRSRMTTKMTGVQAEDSPVTPDLSVLADQLVAAARTQGVELIGSGGLLSGRTKLVLEMVLDVDLSDHLGALTELGTSRAADPARSP